jgi:tetratricopeptide (TPR) repeat protein
VWNKSFLHRRFHLKPIKHILFIIISIQSLNTIAQSTQNNYVCKKQIKEQWRELAEEGKFKEAINLLLDTIQEHKHIDMHSVYWHIGQLYAFDNDYGNAIRYLKKSTDIFDKLADREWRLYYKGTIAFLQKDKQKLESCYKRLWNKHSAYNEKNAFVLKGLYENFDKTYREVFQKL